MQNYSVKFSRKILGVPFPVASFVVRYARSPERAQRAAELRLMRRRRLPDWRLCADAIEMNQQAHEISRPAQSRPHKTPS
jgi:hypothetical protein